MGVDLHDFFESGGRSGMTYRCRNDDWKNDKDLVQRSLDLDRFQSEKVAVLMMMSLQVVIVESSKLVYLTHRDHALRSKSSL